jgi:hypothetical protein
VRSVYPSVSGWNEVLRFLVVPMASIIRVQKVEVNSDPRSEMMLLGSP